MTSVGGAAVVFSARVVLRFSAPATARAVGAALRVDNVGTGLKQGVRGARLTAEAPGASARSLRATLDDWLRCAAAAEPAAHASRVAPK